MTGVVSTLVSTAAAAPATSAGTSSAASAKAATTRPAARSAARSAIAGRPVRCVFGVEAQGNWADFSGDNVSAVSGRRSQPHQDRRVRSVHRPGRLRLEQRAALRQGRCGRHRQQVRHHDGRAAGYWPRPATAVGVPRLAPVSNTASLRTGRSASSTITCSWTGRTSPSSVRRSAADGQHQAGRRSLHRPHQLPIRRPGDRALLSASRRSASRRIEKPRPWPGLFIWIFAAGRAPGRFG